MWDIEKYILMKADNIYVKIMITTLTYGFITFLARNAVTENIFHLWASIGNICVPQNCDMTVDGTEYVRIRIYHGSVKLEWEMSAMALWTQGDKYMK